GLGRGACVPALPRGLHPLHERSLPAVRRAGRSSYLSEGARAYARVAELGGEQCRERRLYEELSARFEYYAGALDYLRKVRFLGLAGPDPIGAFLHEIAAVIGGPPPHQPPLPPPPATPRTAPPRPPPPAPPAAGRPPGARLRAPELPHVAAAPATGGSRASASPSSTDSTGWKRSSPRTSAGTLSRSPRLRSGRMTSVSPAACAASTFCLT